MYRPRSKILGLAEGAAALDGEGGYAEARGVGEISPAGVLAVFLLKPFPLVTIIRHLRDLEIELTEDRENKKTYDIVWVGVRHGRATRRQNQAPTAIELRNIRPGSTRSHISPQTARKPAICATTPPRANLLEKRTESCEEEVPFQLATFSSDSGAAEVGVLWPEAETTLLPGPVMSKSHASNKNMAEPGRAALPAGKPHPLFRLLRWLAAGLYRFDIYLQSGTSGRGRLS